MLPLSEGDVPMPVFHRDVQSKKWRPSELARGPFAGLQGGAIAGLLVAEIESQAARNDWGRAINMHASFLKPVPLSTLLTVVEPVSVGGRASVIDNLLFVEGEDNPRASVRVTLMKDRMIEVPGYASQTDENPTPLDHPPIAYPAPHRKPWFMDTMEVRPAGDICWFKLTGMVVEGAGQLAQIAGPADWAHGLGRPIRNVVADPNCDLSIHVFRSNIGQWIGVKPATNWNPELGIGLGRADLLDPVGVFGTVAMSIALTPLPKP
jgi:hypothetical protein